MKCVILQPSYIPWRGYFHQIQKADVFVFYDDVQYDNHGWRNRNRIKGAGGAQWLTIPVRHRGSVLLATPIHAIPICWDSAWNQKHWRSLNQAYGKAPYFDQYAPALAPFFEQHPEMLADFAIELTAALARLLGIEGTRFVRSSELGVAGVKTDRLLRILESLGASHYITGPSARGYLEEDKFRAAGIGLEYMTYDYPQYPQLGGAFDPQLSIVDLLFMTGPEAPGYIWGDSSENGAADSSKAVKR